MDRRICGAKTRSGDPCRNRQMPNGRCRLHGGKSLVGTASGTFKTGRYSKYLPVHLADKYQDSLKDADLLALRDEIALIDTRVLDWLSGDTVTDEHWENVERLLDLRRRMVETERKRLVDLQQMMTAEQAMTMLAVVVDTVRRHVDDPKVLQSISADLAKLVAVPGEQATQPR